MKLNFGRRLLLFLHWLVSLVLLASVVFKDITADLTGRLASLIGATNQQIIFWVFVGLYALLSVVVVILIFRNDGKRSERGFITMDSSDSGKVRIAVSAIEQMVKQAVCTVDGIADLKIGISAGDDALIINLNVVVVIGSHVPTITLNMQRIIRQYVEMNCGVAVQSVSINVQSVANPNEGGKKGKRGEKGRELKAMTAASEPPVEAAPVYVAPVEAEAPAVNEPPLTFETPDAAEPYAAPVAPDISEAPAETDAIEYAQEENASEAAGSEESVSNEE